MARSLRQPSVSSLARVVVVADQPTFRQAARAAADGASRSATWWPVRVPGRRSSWSLQTNRRTASGSWAAARAAASQKHRLLQIDFAEVWPPERTVDGPRTALRQEGTTRGEARPPRARPVA